MRSNLRNVNINYIYNIFGEHVSGTFKRWIDTNYKLIRATSQVYFLKTCKLNNIVPTHLIHIYKITSTYKHYKTVQKLEKVLYNSQKRILNIEIFDLHRFIYSLIRDLRFLTTILYNTLPANIYNEIFNEYSMLFSNYRYRLSLKYKRKFLWLKHKNNVNSIKHIKPIKYSCSFEELNNNVDNAIYNCTNTTNNLELSQFVVNIDPNEYTHSVRSPLEHTNEKWFINLTNVAIPTQVSNLLQLGSNFSLPIDNQKKIAIHEFIKDIEIHNRYINDTEKVKIRNTIIPFFNRLINKKESVNNLDKRLINLENSTKKFCKNNPNILFTKADKGNVTVAIDREEYIEKMELMLQDENTYTTIKKNPIKSLERKLNDLLKNWFQKGFITKQTYFSMFSSDSILPKAYGLPKIHKKNNPYRIIVSSINTALYPLASFLQTIISDSLTFNNRYVKNSYELYKTLSGKKIDNTNILVSLDVISLFTNVPQDRAIESILNRWTLIEKKTNIPKNDFIGAIELILSSTYFTFNKKIYRQTFGTPMGSPLSPIIANLVLQDLEEKN